MVVGIGGVQGPGGVGRQLHRVEARGVVAPLSWRRNLADLEHHGADHASWCDFADGVARGLGRQGLRQRCPFRDIDIAILVHGNAGGATQRSRRAGAVGIATHAHLAGQRGDVAGCIDLAHQVVPGVGHVGVARRIHRHGQRRVETGCCACGVQVARLGAARATPCGAAACDCGELPGGGEFANGVVAGVCHQHIARGGERHTARFDADFCESPGAILVARAVGATCQQGQGCGGRRWRGWCIAGTPAAGCKHRDCQRGHQPPAGSVWGAWFALHKNPMKMLGQSRRLAISPMKTHGRGSWSPPSHPG
ncbi:hypothetical protein D3C71_851030 [compost metagenome]